MVKEYLTVRLINWTEMKVGHSDPIYLSDIYVLISKWKVR